METQEIVEMLNRARAEELACIRLYAQDIRKLEERGNDFLARLFREQMGEEVLHARWLAARIKQLGGDPTHQPASWCWKRLSGRGATKVRRMLEEAAALERKELRQYEQGILKCALGNDGQTKLLLEQIVESEQSHRDQWISFLAARD